MPDDEHRDHIHRSFLNGGVIPGNETTWKVEVGERVMKGDGTVYQLQEVEGGYRWVEIGKGYAVWQGGPDA